jgi:transposase
MIIDLETVNIYVRPGKTDMRKQINGLSILVAEELDLDPFSGALFLFCSKRRHLLKILYWDRNGFCQWQKRLERDRFPWPMNRSEVQEIDLEKLRQILAGINFWEAHEQLEYSSVY